MSMHNKCKSLILYLKKRSTLLVSVYLVKQQIEHFLHERVRLIPFICGNGYTVKFLVRAKKTYLLQIANLHSERQMFTNRQQYRHTYQERFDREFDILKRLSKEKLSPKPVLLGSHFSLREYCEGKTLSSILSSKIPLSKKIEVLIRVLRAITRAQDLRVFSSDLGPSNILIDGANVRIIDFEMYRIDISDDAQLLEEIRWLVAKMSVLVNRYEWRILTRAVKSFFKSRSKIANNNFDIFPEEF